MIKICIKIHNYFRDNSPHLPLFPSWEGLGVGSDSRFPFPSWEGLGVGSDSRFPIPDPNVKNLPL
ncbi:MAG: hypothetical protein F6K56_08880 [Moorea sp. SIO3G5]|nr:hypothetical protein [Moorena sp. SIO3G5]